MEWQDSSLRSLALDDAWVLFIQFGHSAKDGTIVPGLYVLYGAAGLIWPVNQGLECDHGSTCLARLRDTDSGITGADRCHILSCDG